MNLRSEYRCKLQVQLLQLQLIAKVKVKWSRYRPGVAQRVGRDIALLFHDRGIRRGWVVSSTPQPHFTPGEDPVPIVQAAGWALGPVWTGAKNFAPPNGIRSPHRPARSQSLYRLTYPVHTTNSAIPNVSDNFLIRHNDILRTRPYPQILVQNLSSTNMNCKKYFFFFLLCYEAHNTRTLITQVNLAHIILSVYYI
jgi:hypothetical protein